MEKEGVLSIWVGSFKNQEDFNTYTEQVYTEDGDVFSSFTTDFGIDFYDSAFREAFFLSRSSLLKEMEELSYAESFLKNFNQSDLNGYNAIICLYNFEYQFVLNNLSIQKQRVKFLGAFNFQED